ncbi:hypothetical protein ES703_45765 [subsurface metagenome]
MCWWFKKKEEPKPEWVTQSREQVADEEVWASIHCWASSWASMSLTCPP